MVCTFFTRKDFYITNKYKISTEDPFSGILRFSWTVILQPLAVLILIAVLVIVLVIVLFLLVVLSTVHILILHVT